MISRRTQPPVEADFMGLVIQTLPDLWDLADLHMYISDRLFNEPAFSHEHTNFTYAVFSNRLRHVVHRATHGPLNWTCSIIGHRLAAVKGKFVCT